MDRETGDEGNCDFGDIGITQNSAIEAVDNTGGTVTPAVCPAGENFEDETEQGMSNPEGEKSTTDGANLGLSSQSTQGPHFIILTDGEQGTGINFYGFFVYMCGYFGRVFLVFTALKL